MHRRRQWNPTPVLLPGKSHGRRSLVGYSLWGRDKSDTTGWFHFHFSLSCTGEGNGNPLQCSCLENPRDRGAWWAAVYGVAQSWTRLKRLSSSSRQLIFPSPHSQYSSHPPRPPSHFQAPPQDGPPLLLLFLHFVKPSNNALSSSNRWPPHSSAARKDVMSSDELSL